MSVSMFMFVFEFMFVFVFVFLFVFERLRDSVQFPLPPKTSLSSPPPAPFSVVLGAKTSICLLGKQDDTR
jgi:hypothetical protein